MKTSFFWLLVLCYALGVSLLTPVPAAGRLASVRPEPVDGQDDFLAAAFPKGTRG